VGNRGSRRESPGGMKEKENGKGQRPLQKTRPGRDTEKLGIYARTSAVNKNKKKSFSGGKETFWKKGIPNFTSHGGGGFQRPGGAYCELPPDV